MNPFQRLLRRLGFTRVRRTYHFDQDTVHSLRLIAEREHRTEDDVASELISYALSQRQAFDHNLENWESLSSREQEVAALVCLDYTNQEIAAVLTISQETVKSHVRNILNKFGLRHKRDLRNALSGWDFSAWQARYPRRTN